MPLELSNIVSTTMNDFINYALTITSILILYYIGKLFFVGGPGKEEREKESAAQRQAWTDRWEGWKKNRGEKEAEQKQKKEKERKRLNVSPIKQNLVEAIEAADEVFSLLGKARTERERDKIIDLVKKFDREMDRAGRNLRMLRRKLEGDERNYITDRITDVETAQEYINNNCQRKLPKMSPSFRQEVQSLGIPKVVKDVRALCHNLWDKIEKFHQ